MASKYARRLAVPTELPELLRSLSREILRSFPADCADEDAEAWIYNFAASYFSKKANADPSPGYFALEKLSPDELRDQITELFLDADKDNNGALDRKEFRDVFLKFATDLGFPKPDIRRIMAEADENDDGRIEYHEFVPLAVSAIETVLAKQSYADTKTARENTAVQKSKDFLLHGMDRPELEAVLKEMFEEADADGSGFLSRREFTAALRSSGLGLTRKEINVLLHEVDENDDGEVSYAEFLPICFQLLVEIVADEFEAASTPQDEAELAQFFTDLFTHADVDKTGRLRASHIQTLLRDADLGLQTLQISAVMSEAAVDDDGTVDYTVFARDAASVVASIFQIQMSSTSVEVVRGYRASADATQVLGMSQQEFESQLSAVIAAADTEGSGQVPWQQAMESLQGLGLTTKQAQGIVMLAGIGADNMVNVAAVSHQAFKLLLHMAEQEFMTSYTKKSATA